MFNDTQMVGRQKACIPLKIVGRRLSRIALFSCLVCIIFVVADLVALKFSCLTSAVALIPLTLRL